MNRLTLPALLLAAAAFAPVPCAADKGAIDAEMLSRLRASFGDKAADKALANALRGSDIDVIATSAENKNLFDNNFSHRVKSNGITDQKSSGRCWLFTGLNVLRSQIMAEHDIPELELSQSYNFFFDQLEKANLFLQAIIDTSSLPSDDKNVEWLFQHPISDGGQYTGLSDNLMKYGIVPKSAMTETYSSSNSAKMGRTVSRKLREEGLRLRRMAADNVSPEEITAAKEKALGDVYRILALTLGTPPTEFTWARKDKEGKVIETRTYTPQEFYATFAGNNLKDDYVMLMNDPTREYYRLYEIDYDRHAYDGSNWTYVNLPADDIKKMAIESIKGNEMMYFSCDVGKFLDRERGLLDTANHDYESLFGVTFGMDKADRIRTFDSASSHAMTLVAVDLDESGKPLKWLVENSWGPGANDGHLIITDRWFDEYMFRLVVNRKYVPSETLKILRQTPTKLPAWDPMFSPDL